jgi:hypothetical protein
MKQKNALHANVNGVSMPDLIYVIFKTSAAITTMQYPIAIVIENIAAGTAI